jgi:hypothetical protein
LNATIKEALAGYKAADEDVIKSQTGFAMYSTQNGWIGSLTYLEPGKGYMLYRKRATDTTFYYPVISGSLSGGRPGPGTIIPNADQRPVPGNFSSANNMTIAAVIAPGFEWKNDDNILAFVNGELRGKAKPILNPQINKLTYFFNISGEAEQSLVFMIERNGSIIAQSSTVMSYRTNSIIGTLTKPLELHFSKQAVIITAYPNPFSNTINVSADLRGLTNNSSNEIRLSVVDLAGRLVWSAPIQKMSGTAYTSSWNGNNMDGSPCSAGVYFVRMIVNGVPHVYKVIKQ